MRNHLISVGVEIKEFCTRSGSKQLMLCSSNIECTGVPIMTHKADLTNSSLIRLRNDHLGRKPLSNSKQVPVCCACAVSLPSFPFLAGKCDWTSEDSRFISRHYFPICFCFSLFCDAEPTIFSHQYFQCVPDVIRMALSNYICLVRDRW